MDSEAAIAEHDLDLALAAQLQAALLPRACPSDCPHQRAAARNRMCRSIGGDFYDFLRLNDDQIALAVGDVVGHGVRSSLIMAQIMGFLRFADKRRSRPPQMVAALNRMLIELGEKTGSVTPCSIIYGVIDAPTGLAVFVNAGHPRPFLCGDESCGVTHLHAHNILLGVEDFEPEEICLTFKPGQRLALYTDGLADAASPSGEPFGDERLREAICRQSASDPDQCADAVFAAVAAHRDGAAQLDDETIVVIDRV